MVWIGLADESTGEDMEKGRVNRVGSRSQKGYVRNTASALQLQAIL
jgi:hypothetical protein